MPLDLQATRQHLQDFDFRKLFINELGWNNPPFALKPADAEAKGGIRFHRAPVAVLSGIHVFEITTPGGAIPDAKTRAAIHAAVSALAAENLLIFTDTARTQSLWYWVKREAGKSHARDHLYVKGQPGDLFLSKLAALVVDISELDAQGNIPLTEVARRLKNALDVERVTKKFYGDFDIQRLEFTELIRGIKDDHQRRWYASVLMNRLMFIWFLQKKFFLDGRNSNYLTDKLAFSGQKLGADKFYPVFLNALFFEGFAKPEPARSAKTNALLGKIRYLNGGLFLPHHVELDHGFPDEPRILIPDRAFDNIFNLFGRYSWNLNDTPGGQADEINPDVLGYIFEKYINQKEFGAYYTRPEMTGYLCERTIFKLVLDRINQTLALTPALSPGERENRSQSHGKSSASVSSSAANVSPSPIGWERAGVRVRFHTISDLLLNLDAKICRALVLEILPALRLLDPACGSGAFLVAAMKVLINIYSAILGKVELEFLGDPDLKKWHDEVHGDHRAPAYYIKKRIITENLFGVDIMEEATEIARLRLFLALVASAQTEDQLEPLPNIDFNILAGNSLIGLLHVDPKKFDAPASSPSPLGGERAGVRGEGQTRMTLQHASDLGFAVESKTAPTTKETVTAFVAQQNAARFAALLEDQNRSIELYRKHAFASVAEASSPASSAGVPARSSQRAARTPPEPAGEDACATDFADLVDQNERVLRLREHIKKVRAESYTRLNQMLLDEFNALGIQFEQATWDDRKNDTGKPEKRRLKLSDLEALHPFHWGYEFDRVLAEGGFDGIITNPPWEIFKPNSKEFFEQHSELVSKKKMAIHDFEKTQARLLKDSEIKAAWLEYLSGYPHVSAFYRSTPQYKNQISIVDGKKAGSDTNLYKLFTEQCFNLLRAGGRCGIIIPGGIYTDLGTKQLREMLFSESQTDTIFSFSNERFIFEEVHHAFKFCLLSFEKGGETTSFRAAFRINPRDAIGSDELESFLHSDQKHLHIKTEFVRRLSPSSLSVMEFKANSDLQIVEKLSQFPKLGDSSQPDCKLVLCNEFHMTGDSHLFRSQLRAGRLPLCEGKTFHQFTHAWGEPKYWLDEKEARKALLGKAPDAGQLLDYQHHRLAFRDIAASTNERAMIMTILPRNVFCPHTVSLENVQASSLSLETRFYLLSICNSYVVDYLLRMRITSHLSFFFIYNLPVPRLTAADAAFGPIVKRAAQLICTTPEFDALAKEVGLGSHKSGVSAPAARAQLRAELDGLIAHLYALTESEFAHILTTFPLVAQPVKDAALEAYRAVAKGELK